MISTASSPVDAPASGLLFAALFFAPPKKSSAVDKRSTEGGANAPAWASVAAANNTDDLMVQGSVEFCVESSTSAVFLAAVLFLADARLFDASTIHGCDADLSDRLYLTEQLV